MVFNLKSLGRERLWYFSGGQHGHGIQPFAQGSAGAQNFLGAMPFFGWQEMAWLGQVGCKLGMKSRHLFYKSALSVYLAGSCIFSHVRWHVWQMSHFSRTWCAGVWTTRPTSSECHNVDPGLLDGWRPGPKGCEPEAFLLCWVVNVFAIYLSMCLLIHVFIYCTVIKTVCTVSIIYLYTCKGLANFCTNSFV